MIPEVALSRAGVLVVLGAGNSQIQLKYAYGHLLGMDRCAAPSEAHFNIGVADNKNSTGSQRTIMNTA